MIQWRGCDLRLQTNGAGSFGSARAVISYRDRILRRRFDRGCLSLGEARINEGSQTVQRGILILAVSNQRNGHILGDAEGQNAQ